MMGMGGKRDWPKKKKKSKYFEFALQKGSTLKNTLLGRKREYDPKGRGKLNSLKKGGRK